MGIKNIYKTLFDFTILHHYFLDEGNQSFTAPVTGSPSTVARLQKRLNNNRQQYELRDFMTIVPSQKTVQKLKNWRAVFSFRKESFVVGMKRHDTNPKLPFIPFPEEDFYFDFIVRLTDTYFENYTDISINRSKIIFISNQTEPGSAEDYATSVDFKRISNFNSGSYVPPTHIDLTNDMDSREYAGAFMIIRIHLEGDGVGGDLDLVQAPVNPLDPIEFIDDTPGFEIIFPNRKTKWRYINMQTGAIYTTPVAHPLTKNGFIEISNGGVKYPNPDAKIIILESGTYYSETFI